MDSFRLEASSLHRTFKGSTNGQPLSKGVHCFPEATDLWRSIPLRSSGQMYVVWYFGEALTKR